jgi:NADH dehydrogenase
MILITGASGHIGRHVVRRLMREGLRVRVLLPENKQRSLPWDVEAYNAPEVITGSLLNDEAVFRAVSGAYVIIHLESAMWWGRPRDLERIEVVGTRNLITAARAARVGRIITVSQLGASPSSAFNLLRAKGEVEELIRASGLAYTIIRSGLVFGPEDAFVNHVAMLLAVTPMVFLMPGRGEVSVHPIYIDDLVEIVFRSLEKIDVIDVTVEVGGAEFLSFEDLVRTVMRVIHAPRMLVKLPPYTLRWLTRLYGLVFPRTLMTQQWMDILASNRVVRIGNTYTYFGVRPRRFEDTLVTYMRQRRYFFSALRYIFRRRPRES